MTGKLWWTLNCFQIFKSFVSAVSPGQEFSTTSQKSFEPTGFQNTLSGMYRAVVFSASGADLTAGHRFCLLACDRDPCCDGFILAQVQGGNYSGGEEGALRCQDPWSDGNKQGRRSQDAVRGDGMGSHSSRGHSEDPQAALKEVFILRIIVSY